MPSGKGGKSEPAVTTQIQKVELPKWVEEAGQNNYAQAQQVSANLAGPYKGNTVSSLNGDHDAAFQMVRDNAGVAMPAINTAMGTLGTVQNAGPTAIGAGRFTDANVSRYMNPYTSNVIDAAKATERQTLANNLNSIGDAATQAGAFGGSRMAVQQGAAQAQSALNMGNLTAQLQSQSFDKAQAAIAADQNRALQADTANQTNVVETNRLRALAAAQGAQVGTQAQQSQLQSASSLQAVGDARRSYDQDLLNQEYQRFADERQQPIDQLNILQYGLGVTPYGSTTSGTTTQYGGQQKQNGFAQGIGAIGSIASSFLPMLGLLSDETTKTDVEPLGKDERGVEMAAYRYKGDPKSYPKVVGPASAQQHERAVPGSTTKAPNGKRVIKSNFLAGPVAPPKARSTKRGGKH